MIDLKGMYSFEAEMPDGTLVTSGGDLVGALRVSLLPAVGSGLPQHDLVGLTFERRFIRYFKRMVVGGFDRSAYFRQVEANQTPARVEARKARNEKLGEELPIPAYEDVEPDKRDEISDACVSVVVAAEARVYVNHATGAALVTKTDVELYI